MELDDDRCYAAMSSRDARFDGRFFTAVVTTGIYCRPVCPARTPKRQNVRFFATAAAAEEHGFRPCKRCRPETSAGTPAWQGTSTSVARALRLIEETSMEIDVGTLAARVGMTDRHLRRLFLEHLGTTPIAIIQTRRAHLARRLAEETSLPMTDVAFGAGYSSLRRFNDAMRTMYGCTPGELRRKTVRPRSPLITLALPFRPPMRAESMFGFMSKRAVPGVDEISGTRWHRLARFGSSDGVVILSVDGSVASLTVPSTAAREIHTLVNRARRSLDLSADPSAVEEHLSRDRRLRPLVRRFRGTRIPLAWDPFETSVRAIVGQQVSVAAATTIMSRIAANFGERAVSDETLAHFPSPQRLAEADLSTVGLTKARAAALKSLAKDVAANPALLDRGASLDEAVDRLCSMRGIGPWTAQYIAMRAIGEPDAFPHSDLGLRKAAEKIGIAGDDLLASAEQWRPWRAYAAMILWESLA